MQVLAVGRSPSSAAPKHARPRRPQNKDVTYIKKKKPRKALAHDAARWFGSRGYVVDDVGVNTQTVGDDELVVLSARVLPVRSHPTTSGERHSCKDEAGDGRARAQA